MSIQSTTLDHRVLQPAELAYLGGGPHRAVDTVILGLLESGLLSVDDRGFIHQEPQKPEEARPSLLEIEVWNSFAPSRRLAAAHELVLEGRAIPALRQSLEARQLVRSQEEISSSSVRRQLGGAVVALLGLAGLALTALGWLIFLFGVGLVVIGTIYRPTTTRLGHSLRNRWISEARSGPWPEPLNTTTTAAFGLRKLPDPTIRDLLLTNPWTGRKESSEDGWRGLMDGVVYWASDHDWDWDGDGDGCGCGGCG